MRLRYGSIQLRHTTHCCAVLRKIEQDASICQGLYSALPEPCIGAPCGMKGRQDTLREKKQPKARYSSRHWSKSIHSSS